MRVLLLAALALTTSETGCAAASPAPSASAPGASVTARNSAPEGVRPLAPAEAAPIADAAGESPVSSLSELVAPDRDGSDALPSTAQTGSTAVVACNEQPPQDFLIRSNFLKGGKEALERAIQYRTDTYGHFKGFGRATADAQPPSAYVVSTTFMGLPVKMHRKVVPAIHCVEEEIKRSCADHPYTPQALAGIRFRNTYRGGEVTNHIYGIAIDIDPARNSCCGCVKPWSDVPACTRPAKTEYDHMAMPECWVHVFERYGFYWLGHDRLRDTMHFEFLGDPGRIMKRE